MRPIALAACLIAAAAAAMLAGCGDAAPRAGPAAASGTPTPSPTGIVLKGDLLTREGEVAFGHEFHPGDFIAYGIHLHPATMGIGRIYVAQAPGSPPAQVASIEIAADQGAVLAYYRDEAQAAGFTLDAPDAALPSGERGFLARYRFGGATLGVTAQATDAARVTETTVTVTLTDPKLAPKVDAAMQAKSRDAAD